MATSRTAADSSRSDGAERLAPYSSPTITLPVASTDSKRTRWKKRAGIAILALAASYAFYLVAFNVAFATGLFTGLVNRASTDFHMEMAGAWTIVPGRVHVKDCTLRVEDGDMQFYMMLPDSTVDLNPLALFQRRVHFRHARVRDVRYWFREKVSSTTEPRLVERVALFPKIPGFSDVPLRPSGAAKERTAEEIEKLWSVAVDEVDGTISELWFDEYRYRGNGHVEGAFGLDPLRTLHVAPTRLELRGGDVTVGKEVIAKSFVMTLKASLPRFDVRHVEGIALLKAADLEVELSADLVALPLPLYAEDIVRIGPGGGRLEIAGGIKRGIPSTGSRIALEVDAICRKAPIEVRGGAHVNARFTEDGLAEALARVPVASMVVGDDAGKTTFSVRGVDVRARIALPTIDEPTFEGGTVVIASTDAPDLQFLSRLLGEGVPRAGNLHASFRGSVDREIVARGKLEASAQNVDLAFTGARVSGMAEVSGSFTSGPWLAGGRFTNARITSPRVSLKLPGVPARKTAVVGTAQEISWTGLVPRTFAARAFVRGTDARILTAIVEKDEGVEAMAARSLVGPSPFSGGGSVYVANGVVRARIGQAVAGKVSVTGGLVQRKAGLDAAFLLRALGLSIGLSVVHGEVGIKPLKSAEWLDVELGRLGLLGANETGRTLP